MDIHIQSHNSDLYKRSVINMDPKLHNKLPSTQNKQIVIRPLTFWRLTMTIVVVPHR